MKAYIISLDKAKKKREYLLNKGVDTVLVNGVKIKETSQKEIDEYIGSANAILPYGLMGCAMAHIKAWEIFIASKENNALFFEEDVEIVDDFTVKMQNVLDKTPDNFDSIYLGCVGCYPEYQLTRDFFSVFGLVKNKDRDINDIVRQPAFSTANHSYILSRTGAIKYINYLKGKIYTHFDICIQVLSNKGKIARYSSIEKLATQTSIADLKSNNMTKSYPLILAKILDHCKFDDNISPIYGLNIQYLKFGPFNISITTVFVLLISIACVVYGISFKNASIVYFLISLPDIIFLGSYEVVILYYIIFIIPYLLAGKLYIGPKN